MSCIALPIIFKTNELFSASSFSLMCLFFRLRLLHTVHTPTEMTADALARSLFAKKTGIPQNVEKPQRDDYFGGMEDISVRFCNFKYFI